MKILVTGGTGLIGKDLCHRLSAAGHEVAIVSRRVPSSTPYRVFVWDPLSSPPPADAIEGTDAVIHLAGEPVSGSRWTPEVKRRIRESRVTGTRNLVEGIAKCTSPPRILIGASAVGFYGDRGEDALDEAAPRGTGFLSDTCVEWETEGKRAEALGLRVAQVRIGVVLSRSGGALSLMLPAFKFGLAASLGDGRQWFPWIHIDDVVGIILHSLLNEEISGPINAVSPGIVRNEQFTRSLAQALHRPAFLTAPSFALNLLMGEMSGVVLASQRVVPRRVLDTGYQFFFPDLDQALAELLK